MIGEQLPAQLRPYIDAYRQALANLHGFGEVPGPAEKVINAEEARVRHGIALADAVLDIASAEPVAALTEAGKRMLREAWKNWRRDVIRHETGSITFSQGVPRPYAVGRSDVRRRLYVDRLVGPDGILTEAGLEVGGALARAAGEEPEWNAQAMRVDG